MSARIQTVQQVPFQKPSESENISYKKLTKVEIFRAMKNNICSIEIGDMQASGFFYDKKIVVSTCHSAEGLTATDQSVSILFNGEPHGGSLHRGDHTLENLTSKAKHLDLISFEVESCEDVENFPLIDFDLEEGMTVYFGGFPLSQQVPTFHKGTISSLLNQGDFQHFTIDGTVVPGNSGGPVLMQREGKLYLAGIIVAEVADLDPSFHPRSSTFELLAINDTFQDLDTIQYSDGSSKQESRTKNVIEAILGLQRNISTGIGTAIDARAIQSLLDAKISLSGEMSEDEGILVGKKKSQVTRTYGRTKSGKTEYMEMKGSGSGPRTINVNIGGNVANYVTNPHWDRNYNRYQGNFYLAAAEAIERAYLANTNTFISPLPFKFMRSEHKMEKQ